MKEIFIRRSIRNYTQEIVEDEKIDKILRAGMQAPSAGIQQAWEFIVVKNKERLEKLSKMSMYAAPIAKAPVAIVVLGNENNMREPRSWQQDLGAATENILLEAVSLELGAVWIGVESTGDDSENLSSIFTLPSNIKPFAIIAIGYPAKGQENKFIDRYDATKVHEEDYYTY